MRLWSPLTQRPTGLSAPPGFPGPVGIALCEGSALHRAQLCPGAPSLLIIDLALAA